MPKLRPRIHGGERNCKVLLAQVQGAVQQGHEGFARQGALVCPDCGAVLARRDSAPKTGGTGN